MKAKAEAIRKKTYRPRMTKKQASEATEKMLKGMDEARKKRDKKKDIIKYIFFGCMALWFFTSFISSGTDEYATTEYEEPVVTTESGNCMQELLAKDYDEAAAKDLCEKMGREVHTLEYNGPYGEKLIIESSDSHTAGGGTTCGNGVCDSNEDATTCASDCSANISKFFTLRNEDGSMNLKIIIIMAIGIIIALRMLRR